MWHDINIIIILPLFRQGVHFLAADISLVLRLQNILHSIHISAAIELSRDCLEFVSNFIFPFLRLKGNWHVFFLLIFGRKL
jgi:hypothetical protein